MVVGLLAAQQLPRKKSKILRFGSSNCRVGAVLPTVLVVRRAPASGLPFAKRRGEAAA